MREPEARGGTWQFRDGAFALSGRGACELVLPHGVENAAHVFVPHLTPAPGYVVGDWVFRSPAIVVANAAVARAFVVDVDDVRALAGTGLRAWLDYDHPRGEITLAAGAYREEGHVFFVRETPPETEAPVSLRLHLVESRDANDLANPYGLAARFAWARWGHEGFERAPRTPFDRFAEAILGWAFDAERGWAESVWQEVRIDGRRIGAAPVFIVDVGRHPSVPREERTWREPRSIWNQVWFSTQRCANGLLRHARRTSDAALEARARDMTAIALSAPQTDGLFPQVLLADAETWRWTGSDRRPPSATSDACHLASAAFTCRMLLEWHGLTGDPRARAYVRAFADRLISLQRPSGAFPGWVEPGGSLVPELLEGPESAVSVALLFELGETEAALRGAAMLEGVAREARWEDFETYYSCARWAETLGRRVERCGVFKQNTLSIAWCAEAFWLAWGTTNDARWRVLARRCIDELSLYQAVWDPPFLPAPAHGGFGVMNADSEWNDARQSLFAPLYLEMGRALGDRELTERGLSALRASFSMLYAPENEALARAYEARFPFFGPESYGFMMENQGHDPRLPIGTFTIFTWGNGSAVATLAKVRDLFPELDLR